MKKNKVLTLYAYVSSAAYDQLCQIVLPLLPNAEAKKVLNTRRKETVLLSLAGKYLLREGLLRLDLDPALIKEIHYNAHRRPIIGHTFDFNISHSGHLVACALSRHTKIGLDIERIKPYRDSHLHAFFDEKERQMILEAKDHQQTFYDLWTRKEAVLKADGRGLTLARKKLRFEGNLAVIEDDDNWEIHALAIDEQYAANLAVEPSMRHRFILEEFRLPDWKADLEDVKCPF